MGWRTEEAAGCGPRREPARAQPTEAMHSDELTTAGDVDFSRLGDEQKAEVNAQTFANAIQRESGSREKHPLPTLLDEVFRQDFICGFPRWIRSGQDLVNPWQVLSPPGKMRDKANERAFPHWGAPEIATQSPQSRQPAPWARNESRSQDRRLSCKIYPRSQPRPAEAEPARPALSGSSLENTVRDMLRPLMMQWLNDHMPRILENAIREEIATRGLLPKTEK